MEIKEVNLNETIMARLIALSEDWEKESSCYSYRKNTPEDLEGNRVFVANAGDAVIGYLFGHNEVAKETTSVYPAGTVWFEIEELYVAPDFRGKGIGKKLFRYAEEAVSGEADMLLLGTATKNFRAILHFYIDELGLEFWSARLFKRINKNADQKI